MCVCVTRTNLSFFFLKLLVEPVNCSFLTRSCSGRASHLSSSSRDANQLQFHVSFLGKSVEWGNAPLERLLCLIYM